MMASFAASAARAMKLRYFHPFTSDTTLVEKPQEWCKSVTVAPWTTFLHHAMATPWPMAMASMMFANELIPARITLGVIFSGHVLWALPSHNARTSAAAPADMITQARDPIPSQGNLAATPVSQVASSYSWSTSRLLELPHGLANSRPFSNSSLRD